MQNSVDPKELVLH